MQSSPKTCTFVLPHSVDSPVGHIKWEYLYSSRQCSTYIKTIQKINIFFANASITFNDFNITSNTNMKWVRNNTCNALERTLKLINL